MLWCAARLRISGRVMLLALPAPPPLPSENDELRIVASRQGMIDGARCSCPNQQAFTGARRGVDADCGSQMAGAGTTHARHGMGRKLPSAPPLLACICGDGEGRERRERERPKLGPGPALTHCSPESIKISRHCALPDPIGGHGDSAVPWSRRRSNHLIYPFVS